jgi:hypothetical protein
MVRVSPGDQRFEWARKEWPSSVNSYSTRGGISATRGHRDRAQSGEDRLPAEGKGDAWNKDGLAELLRGHDAVMSAFIFPRVTPNLSLRPCVARA